MATTVRLVRPLLLHVADVLPADQCAKAHRFPESGGLRGLLALGLS